MDTRAPAVSVRRAYADSRWGQIHYRIAQPAAASPAPPLLCLHQTPKSGWEFEPIMALLGAGRTVIAADTPGYGESDGPPAPVAVEDYAAAMAALMEDLGHPNLDVMGIHTGAVLATQLARSLPERVERVVLVGLPGYEAAVRADKLSRLAAYPRPQADLSHVEAVWRVMQTLMDPRTNVAWRHRSLAENLRAGERMSWGYAAVYGYDLLGALDEVRQSTLVINPEDDLAAVTPAAARRLADARVVDLPGTKHGLFAVETLRVVDLVSQFLQRP